MFSLSQCRQCQLRSALNAEDQPCCSPHPSLSRSTVLPCPQPPSSVYVTHEYLSMHVSANECKLTFLSMTDTYIRMYIHCKNRSFIQSLVLMRLAINTLVSISFMVSQHSNYMYEDQLVGMLYRNFHKHSNPPTLLKLYSSWVPYSGKLLREKTFANWWKIHFSQRKRSRIAPFSCANGCHAPKFREITFTNSHKTTKFAKVFSLESFPLYGMLVTYGTPTLLRTLLLLKMFRSLPYGSAPSSGALLMTLYWMPLPYQPYSAGGNVKSFVLCLVFLLVSSLLLNTQVN